MSVRLHIDRLVLDGITMPHADRPRMQAAIEAELTRLIGEGGVSQGFEAGLAVPTLAANDMRLAAGAGPHELGQRIASALYGGLKR